MEEDVAQPVDPVAWRLRWYPRMVLGALALALIVVVSSGEGSSTATGRIGGDYPAFYGAATIVLDGDVEGLYDSRRQHAAQVDLSGDESGYLAFAYPPHVAIAYAPLASLPYRISYLAHTALMVGAVLAALHLVRPLIGVVDRWYWLAAAASISAFPLFRALGAGQNTALTLLLVVVVWRALADDRETMAGVAAGLLLFRPQYALPIIGLLLLARHRRAVVAASGVAVLTWLANGAVLGADWVPTWLDQVGPFIETDAVVNAQNSISLIGFGTAVMGDMGEAIGTVLAVTVAVVLALAWVRPARIDLASRMALTAVGVVLISPHAMFYDAGILVITAAVAVDREWISVRASAIVWALTIGHVGAGPLGATPLALLVIASFPAVLAMIWAARTAAPTPVEVAV